MKYETATVLLAFFGLATAAPTQESRNLPIPRHILRGREVPQEHSHEKFLTSVRTSLNTNNPDGIVDPTFGLLGNAAAAAGLGKLTDTECLQQSTADQAFTNAKAAGDITGMTNALAYRALERNTGQVGLQSNSCTSVTAANAEIAAVSQHQDPASSGAAATNKAIVLTLAKQIASIGGNASVALDTGTFAPGSLTDSTGKGNTCDTQNDPVGCIFTENLLVPDATEDEIAAAVGGVSATSSPTTVNIGDSTFASIAASTTVDIAASTTVDIAASTTVDIAASTTVDIATSTTTATATATPGTNVQTFTGALGGIGAPPVIETSGDRPFSTDGATFVNAAAALQRSCSVQHNQCADAANAGTLAGGEEQCETQENACNASISS